MKEKKSRIFIVSSAIILLLTVIFIVLCQMPAYREKEKMTEAILQFATSSYDSVFLSTFPTSTLQAEDFYSYEACTVAKPDIVISDYETLRSFFQYIKDYNHEIREFYLGISPDKISAEQAEALVQMFPDTIFKVFPEWLPLEQWKKAEDPDALIDQYQEMVYAMTHQPNTLVYPFFSHEWIIADKSNYLEGSLLKEDIALNTYLLSLIGPDDAAHSFYARPDRVEELFDEFRSFLTAARAGTYSYPDLSDWEIIFLGDSVIGNYQDRHSIPGYVNTFSGAKTYNLGWGGATASGHEKTEKACLSRVLNAFLTQNPANLPNTTQPYAGLTKYLSQKKTKNAAHHTLFVLHFGMNDYFNGVASKSSDPLDIETFQGAMRDAIKKLKDHAPDALICLMVPNQVFAFQHGNEILNPVEGTTFADYAQAILDLAQEEQLLCLDNYHSSHIEESQWLYYADDIHPNEYGRYRIAYALMQLLATVTP